jgi:gamma-glutamyltranspeptidase / glutathione hydrolase
LGWVADRRAVTEDGVAQNKETVMPCSRSSTLRRPRALPLAALLACSLIGAAHADEGDRPHETARAASSKVKPLPPSGPAFRKGVVAVANPYGAEAGARILEQGGNAVDAAIAIAYALNVVEPQSAGIGGGGFMMIHLAGRGGHGYWHDDDEDDDKRGKHRGPRGRTFVIDTREKAPAAATPNMFVGVPNASLQGVAVGVPGMVRGSELALRRFGRLDLSDVLHPAITLADDGFAATPRYALVSCNARSQNSPESTAVFCPNGNGTLGPVAGSLVQNKPLAQTLRLIALHGADCFYRYMPEKGCDIAKGIVEGQKFAKAVAVNGVLTPGKGGSMSYEDLAAYRPALRAPTQGSYRGYTIKAMSPPSSGGLTLLQMLKMLERFPVGDATQGYGFGSVKTSNVMAEAMRLAFADRSIWMGDADFVPVPQRGLLDSSYVGARGAAIMPGARIDPNPLPGDPREYELAGWQSGTRLAVAAPVTGPGETTTHFSVVDRWGNMVSFTNTIESSHGIGVFAGYTQDDGTKKSHGFLLNNELTDFNTAKTTNPFTGSAGYNDVQPAKRPRSSMTPAMIFSPDGEPLIAYGSPGGATIINSVLNVTLNLLDHKMTLQEAINAPRLSVTSATSNVTVEAAYPPAAVEGLRALGYTVGNADIGSVQAVLLDPRNGKQFGAADARREGTVIGLPRPQNR